MTTPTGETCKHGHLRTSANTRFVTRGKYVVRICRDCTREYSAKWRRANPEKTAAHLKRSRQKRRQAINAYEKTPAQRERRAAMKRRLRQNPEWRERERKRNRSYVLALPPEVRQERRDYVNRWRKDNRERVRELNRLRLIRESSAPGAGYLTVEKLRARILFYAGRCFYCDAPDAKSLDHRIPLARGGSQFPSNLVPSCKLCNSRKGTRTPKEWAAST